MSYSSRYTPDSSPDCETAQRAASILDAAYAAATDPNTDHSEIAMMLQFQEIVQGVESILNSETAQRPIQESAPSGIAPGEGQADKS